MKYDFTFNSRIVAFSLAFLIAVISVTFLSFFEIPFIAFIVIFLISFSSAALLFYLALEFLVFQEINELHQIVNKLKKKDFKLAKKKKRSAISPIKKLNDEIRNYAFNKQQEIEHLRQLEIYRREFLADVSHELKTPIFAAQGYLHTLIDGAIDDLQVRDKFLGKAVKSLDGLNILVQQLLMLSQLEAGFITMNYSIFDLRELCRDIFEQLEGKAEEKSVKLLFKLNPKPIWVSADKQRIRHVMQNLIENAIKYGKKNTKVMVNFQTNKSNTHYKIIVEDDGQGIPAEHLERIFERFYRVDKSRAKHKGGSGLGLAIVKQIVEAHQSKINVKSKVKKGTVFSFFLEKAQRYPQRNTYTFSKHLLQN